MATMTAAEQHKVWFEREMARSAEAERAASSAYNWERVCAEQPRTVLSPPQAVAVRAGKIAVETEGGETEGGETEGQKVMRLWASKGMKVEKL